PWSAENCRCGRTIARRGWRGRSRIWLDLMTFARSMCARRFRFCELEDELGCETRVRSYRHVLTSAPLHPQPTILTMQFRFDLSRCAANNSEAAVIREATRLSCIAWCLQHLGHQVSVPAHLIPAPLRNSPRYSGAPFCELDKQDRPGVGVSAECD